LFTCSFLIRQCPRIDHDGWLVRSPGSESICPTPIVRLVITNHAGRIVLKLRLTVGHADGVMV
jgi:hypothetical protein